jgi:hypothetical protein
VILLISDSEVARIIGMSHCTQLESIVFDVLFQSRIKNSLAIRIYLRSRKSVFVLCCFNNMFETGTL